MDTALIGLLLAAESRGYSASQHIFGPLYWGEVVGADMVALGGSCTCKCFKGVAFSYNIGGRPFSANQNEVW